MVDGCAGHNDINTAFANFSRIFSFIVFYKRVRMSAWYAPVTGSSLNLWSISKIPL